MDYRTKFVQEDGLNNLSEVYFSFLDRKEEYTSHDSDRSWIQGSRPSDIEHSSNPLYHYLSMSGTAILEDDLSAMSPSTLWICKELSSSLKYSGNSPDLLGVEFGEVHELRIIGTEVDEKFYTVVSSILSPLRRLTVFYNDSIDINKWLRKILEEHIFDSVEFHRDIIDEDRGTDTAMLNEHLFLQGENIFVDYISAYRGIGYTASRKDIFIDILNAKLHRYSGMDGEYYAKVSEDLIVNDNYTFIPTPMSNCIPTSALEGFRHTSLGVIKHGSMDIIPIVQWRSLCTE